MDGLLKDHLEKLGHFTAIAEASSIHQAAEKLHLSQPALGRSLKKLEEILGYQLLIRTPRGTTLTERGKKLYQFGRQILSETKSFERGLKQEKDILRIGTFTSLANSLIADWVKKLQLQGDCPNIEILGLFDNESLYKMLEEEKIQVAVMVEPRPVKGIYLKKVASSGLGFYVLCKDYKLPKRKILFSELNNIPLIVNERACLGQGFSLDALLWTHKKGSPVTINTNNFAIALEWCLQGLGVAILPDILVQGQQGLRKLSIENLPKGFGKSDIYALYTEKSVDAIGRLLRF